MASEYTRVCLLVVASDTIALGIMTPESNVVLNSENCLARFLGALKHALGKVTNRQVRS